MPTFLALLGMFISVLLIGIILLQRGRGGGLVGALSGLGGQSAFGTKAGDMFTRITIGIALVWVLLAGGHGIWLRGSTEKFKNESKEVGMSQDKGSGSSKSDDSKSDASKTESGLGSASSETKDEGKQEGDSKSTAKTDESTKEVAPSGDKKPETAPKSKEPPKKELDETDKKSDDKSGDKK